MRTRYSNDHPAAAGAPSTFAPDKPGPTTDDMERAARLAGLAWDWLVTREGFRSHRDRLRALEAAGAVADEAYFARLHGRAA